MPRRLIIGILIVLILGIIGGTVALVVNRIRSSAKPTPTPITGYNSLDPSNVGSQNVVNPGNDDDNDDLNNADEALWGTDPDNPDTDGDGFNDGAEVANNHNPTIAGPNDELPDGFVPGREINPLNVAINNPVSIDDFFAKNLDLSGGTKNLTEGYQKKYPEDERTPDTLKEYIDVQPIITQLPEPLPKASLIQKTDTPLVFAEYMDIAGNLAVFSNQTILIESINRLYGDGDPSGMYGMASLIRSHQGNLIDIRVPPSAANLHKLLLGYTELLAATYDLMGEYVDDPAKGVLAMRQLDEIDRKYYPLIEQEVARLTLLQYQLNSGE